jgi:hypothetical protein
MTAIGAAPEGQEFAAIGKKLSCELRPLADIELLRDNSPREHSGNETTVDRLYLKGLMVRYERGIGKWMRGCPSCGTWRCVVIPER